MHHVVVPTVTPAVHDYHAALALGNYFDHVGIANQPGDIVYDRSAGLNACSATSALVVSTEIGMVMALLIAVMAGMTR